MKPVSLRYADERDKTYGITGATIALVAIEGGQYLSGISLDASPSEMIVLSHEFGLPRNPRMSAKIVWQESLTDLKLITTMVLGNIACRRYVLSHCTPGDEDVAALRQATIDDGREYCDLDADEAENLFNSCVQYVRRVFTHGGVQDVAHRFADELSCRRELSRAEVLDLLSTLGLR